MTRDQLKKFRDERYAAGDFYWAAVAEAAMDRFASARDAYARMSPLDRDRWAALSPDVETAKKLVEDYVRVRGLAEDVVGVDDFDPTMDDVTHALHVLVLTKKTRDWLKANDPKAFEQAVKALDKQGYEMSARLARLDAKQAANDAALQNLLDTMPED